jgi:hypothetical protein
MDQHPVPQNVTSFEFHLVGDMTIRQFIYLASGLASAYIIFVVAASKFPIIAWPLILLFGLTGIAYAFLPIMERPLDHWTGAFFRAIFSPTQYKYDSKLINKDSPIFNNRLNIYLKQSLALESLRDTEPIQTPEAKPPAQPTAGTSLQKSPTESHPTQAAPPPPPKPEPQPQPEIRPEVIQPLPSSEELQKTVDLAKKAQDVQNRIVQTEKLLNQIKTSAATPGADSTQFAERFQKVLTDLQALNQSAAEISAQMATILKSESTARTIPKTVVKPTLVPTLNLTSTANIINGIVTDSQSNYLEGAIIVAHDKQGLPVRALKTNKLGQFIAATPLANGTYTIITEKESLIFDDISITLNGTVLNPIVIAAKKAERPQL